ncbi:MAG TPA: hypothetical protein VHO07_27330, partial [Streptosporangiaceae bacterium]|nr:hypothetical protein [Streptosporangiaceae bacterium]
SSGWTAWTQRPQLRRLPPEPDPAGRGGHRTRRAAAPQGSQTRPRRPNLRSLLGCLDYRAAGLTDEPGWFPDS